MHRQALLRTFFGWMLPLALFLCAFFLYSAATGVVYRHRLPLLATHYAMPDVDTDGGFWYQWYLAHIQTNNKIYDVTDVMSYPIGYDIAFSPVDNLLYTLLSKILALSPDFDWSQLVLINNLSTLATYPLIGVFTFALAWTVTKKFSPSFVAGWLGAFSYFFVLMGRGQMSINHTWWVPFYLLVFFLYLRTKKNFYMILSTLIFGLMFQADAYYAFFSGIFSFIFFFSFPNEPLKERFAQMGRYYLLLFSVLVLLNINFIVNNLYQFNIMVRAQTGRMSSPENELVSATTYFSVFENTYLFSAVGRWAHVLLISVITIGLSGFWFVRKLRREYLTFALSFLICVVLSVRVSLFSWVHSLYFEYFGMFRGVGRFNVFAMMFLGLMVAIVLTEFFEKFSVRKIARVGICVALCVIYLMSTYPKDGTWLRTTSMASLADLYAPLRNDTSITAIAAYPMTLGAVSYGFPSTYQLIGQVLHEKPLASGVSPFEWETRIHYNEISDIRRPETLDELQKWGINTIVVYNQLLEGSSDVSQTLQSDPRIHFLGRFTSSADEGYISTVDRSKDISVYRLDLLEKFSQKRSLLMWSNDELSPSRHTPYHYDFTIPSTGNLSGELRLNLPYSTQWRLYSGKYKHILQFGPKQPVFTELHHRDSFGQNAWTGELPPGDYSIIFARSFTRTISQLVFWSGITGLSLLLIVLWYKEGLYEQ